MVKLSGSVWLHPLTLRLFLCATQVREEIYTAFNTIYTVLCEFRKPWSLPHRPSFAPAVFAPSCLIVRIGGYRLIGLIVSVNETTLWRSRRPAAHAHTSSHPLPFHTIIKFQNKVSSWLLSTSWLSLGFLFLCQCSSTQLPQFPHHSYLKYMQNNTQSLSDTKIMTWICRQGYCEFFCDCHCLRPTFHHGNQGTMGCESGFKALYWIPKLIVP